MSLRTLSFIALFLPICARAQVGSERDPPLWSWFGRCPHPSDMAVELRVDGHLQKRAVVAFCQLRRAEIQQYQYDAILSVRFRSARRFQQEYTTDGAETIEGDIWQAGADRDAVTLGVSFFTKRQVLLNTLYFLVPRRRRTAELDRGITVTSYPVSPR